MFCLTDCRPSTGSAKQVMILENQDVEYAVIEIRIKECKGKVQSGDPTRIRPPGSLS